MLVNISYSVDFEEVPKKIREFLDDIHDHMENGARKRIDTAHNALAPGQENIGKCIQTIDKVRQELIKIDVRLNDCVSILRGYERELIADPEAQVPEHPSLPESAATGQAPSENLVSLQKDLEKLKETLKAEYDETTSG